MKSLLLILSYFLISCFSLETEAQVRERVFVHTDKDCYIAGEDIRLKFYVINPDFQPSVVSKVGYVEICNTEKPQIQLKVALEKGSGAGKIRIPMNIPSGTYQLSGYTRYMRNEGEKAFFKKQIAIVNAGLQTPPDPKQFVLVEKAENIPSAEQGQTNEKSSAGLRIGTDQNIYGIRKKVALFLEPVPENTADLVVSVSRNDSIAFVSEMNEQEWLKQAADTFRISNQWLPEYEGHIVTGRFVPAPQEQMISSIAFVGKDIRYFNGQTSAQNNTVNFYTAGIYGRQQIVATAVSILYNETPYRVDLITPFEEALPDSLPVLLVFPNKKQLLERYIGAQIQEKMDGDSIGNHGQSSDYCTFQPLLSYDLDQYVRFNSIAETILEFVSRVHVNKVGGNRIIRVYLEDSQRFSMRTLVLLDGIPVYNHEDILQYNPMYIKKINVYDGQYFFGGENFEGIVSFITRNADLSFFQLSGKSQLLDYDCPQLPSPDKIQDYSTGSTKTSRKPDFRHTLYWNPFVEHSKGQPIHLSFYTSDLCGEFKVTVEGITTDGKIIHGTTSFQVADSIK